AHDARRTSHLARRTTHQERRTPHQERRTSRLSQNPPGAIPCRRAHDAAAWVGGGSTHPEIPNRRLVLRPARNRPREEQLLERQLALEDVSLGQPELALDVERRQ